LRRESFRSCACGLTGRCRPLYSGGFAKPAVTVGGPKAPVAELVDALDSKSSSARSAGSIPARGTSRAFAQDYRQCEGGGLFILVSKTGSRLWRYGGPIALTPSRSSFTRPVSCHFSRSAHKRDDAKKLIAEGIDPSLIARKRAAMREWRALREHAAAGPGPDRGDVRQEASHA
jgi:hypothetical protein